MSENSRKDSRVAARVDESLREELDAIVDDEGYNSLSDLIKDALEKAVRQRKAIPVSVKIEGDTVRFTDLEIPKPLYEQISTIEMKTEESKPSIVQDLLEYGLATLHQKVNPDEQLDAKASSIENKLLGSLEDAPDHLRDDDGSKKNNVENDETTTSMGH